MNKEPKITPLKIENGIASGGQVEKEPKQSWEERWKKFYHEQIGFEKHFPNLSEELWIKFISQEIQKAYQKGIVDAVKELEELGYNKETVQKAREEERIKIREFLSNSSIWDTEYIYTRKALLLQKFDELNK